MSSIDPDRATACLAQSSPVVGSLPCRLDVNHRGGHEADLNANIYVWYDQRDTVKHWDARCLACGRSLREHAVRGDLCPKGGDRFRRARPACTFPTVPMLDSHDNQVEAAHFVRMSLRELEPLEAEPRTWLAALPAWGRMSRFVGRGDIGTLCLCEVVPHEGEAAWCITRKDTRTLSGSEMEELYRMGRLSGIGKMRPVEWSIQIIDPAEAR